MLSPLQGPVDHAVERLLWGDQGNDVRAEGPRGIRLERGPKARATEQEKSRLFKI